MPSTEFKSGKFNSQVWTQKDMVKESYAKNHNYPRVIVGIVKTVSPRSNIRRFTYVCGVF